MKIFFPHFSSLIYVSFFRSSKQKLNKYFFFFYLSSVGLRRKQFDRNFLHILALHRYQIQLWAFIQKGVSLSYAISILNENLLLQLAVFVLRSNIFSSSILVKVLDMVIYLLFFISYVNKNLKVKKLVRRIVIGHIMTICVVVRHHVRLLVQVFQEFTGGIKFVVSKIF